MRVITDFIADIRFGARLLVRNPGFAAVAVLSLALGIGGTTAIFTLVDALVLRALPISEPAQLYVAEFRAADGTSSPRISWSFYEQLRTDLAGTADLCAGSATRRMLVRNPGDAGDLGDMRQVQLLSGECFSLLRQRPQVGRLLTPADNRIVDGHPVAVVSDGFWTRQLGRAPDVVGRTISVNGQLISIVGVTAPGFFGVSIDQTPDLWLPVMMQHAVHYMGNASIENGDGHSPWVRERGISWLSLMLRIPDSRQVPSVTEHVNVVLHRALSELESYRTDPEARRQYQALRAFLKPGDKGVSAIRSQLSAPLFVLLAMVSLLLLIACANIASLLMARAATRQRELAVRVSIGAGAGRLLRQLLAESLVLAVAGGLAGLLVARWGTDALLALFASPTTPPAVSTAMDARVLGFALLVSFATGLLFGLLPALRAARISPAETLGAMSRSVIGSALGPRRLPLGRLLVAGQIALTVLLLSIAVLFSRTLERLARVDLGLTRGEVLMLRIDPIAAGYEPARLQPLYDRLWTRIAAVPGVQSAALSLGGPLSGSMRSSSFRAEGYVHGRSERMDVQEEVVTDDYFKALGIRLLQGRTFGPSDTTSSRKVSVISESMAKRYFKGTSPIGRHWAYDDNIAKGFEIIGVVGDVHHNELRTSPPNMAYRPIVQSDEYLRGVEVRTSGPAAALAADIRRALADVDPRLPVSEVATLNERVDFQLRQEKLLAALTTCFGAAALLLGCLGLYGTMSYSVTRRTSELGMRMALGAGRRDVLWLVMREAGAVVLVGLALGLPIAMWSASHLDRLLYEVSAFDAWSYGLAAGVLAVATTGAALLPARRAAALEPMMALRTE
jgi:predicted permease